MKVNFIELPQLGEVKYVIKEGVYYYHPAAIVSYISNGKCNKLGGYGRRMLRNYSIKVPFDGVNRKSEYFSLEGWKEKSKHSHEKQRKRIFEITNILTQFQEAKAPIPTQQTDEISWRDLQKKAEYDEWITGLIKKSCNTAENTKLQKQIKALESEKFNMLQLFGDNILRSYNSALYKLHKAMLNTDGYFVPCQIVEIALDAYIIKEKMSSQELNDYIEKKGWQEKIENLWYTKGQAAGEKYAKHQPMQGRDGKEHKMLCWTYRGLGLILASLYFDTQCNNKDLFE